MATAGPPASQDDAAPRRTAPSEAAAPGGGAAERPPGGLLLAGLLAFGVLGNLVTVQLLPGVELIFGSIATLVIVRAWGPWWGVLSAVLASASTIVLWNHPYAILIFGLEAMVVGLLLPRSDGNLPLAAAVYWLLLGIPLVFLTYSGLMDLGTSTTLVVALKQAVNGIFNAMIANVLLDHTPLLGWRTSRTVPLQRLLFNLLTVLVLGTGLLMTVFGAREELARLEADLVARVDAAHHGLMPRLQSWTERHLRTVELLAAEVEALGWDEERLQARVELVGALADEFHNVYIANAEGVTVAFAPRTNADGASTLGLDFSDRPYFDEVSRALRPLVSPVFRGRGGTREPIIVYVAPVLDGHFQGFALGALNLDEVAGLLERHVRGTGIRAVLVDPTAQVIASTDRKVRVGSRYDPEMEGRIELHDGWFEWSPPPRAGVPALRRYGAARYGRFSDVGAPAYWQLYLDVSGGPLQRYLNRRLTRALGFMLGLTLLVLPVAALVSTWLTDSLQRLATQSTDVPRRLQRGLPVRWPRSRIQELDALALNFEQMTEALRSRMNALAAADQAKDDFLAMLGHELRNPLSPVTTAVELLRRPGVSDAAAARALGVLDRQTRHMSRLVDDLLDLSRITRGKIELRKTVLDLRRVVRAAVEGARPAVEEAGHTLTLKLDEAPLWVRGDETRLEQVVANLLNNAVKYTPAGGHIAVDASTDDGTVSLGVQDDGIGMDEALLQSAFDPFQQGSQSLDRSKGGLGVGLTLVRRLVELHGGRVWAESEGPGTGTLVRVELPRVEAPLEEPPPEVEVSGAESRSVVVVDDNEDAVELLAELLRTWGHRVETAHDGATALAHLAEDVPDVVFLDIGLPGMSGYEVAREIRRDPRLTGVMLVALTGYGQEEDRERSRAAGFDVHLTKPVDLDEVERVLADLDGAGEGG